MYIYDSKLSYIAVENCMATLKRKKKVKNLQDFNNSKTALILALSCSSLVLRFKAIDILKKLYLC